MGKNVSMMRWPVMSGSAMRSRSRMGRGTRHRPLLKHAHLPGAGRCLDDGQRIAEGVLAFGATTDDLAADSGRDHDAVA